MFGASEGSSGPSCHRSKKTTEGRNRVGDTKDPGGCTEGRRAHVRCRDSERSTMARPPWDALRRSRCYDASCPLLRRPSACPDVSARRACGSGSGSCRAHVRPPPRARPPHRPSASRLRRRSMTRSHRPNSIDCVTPTGPRFSPRSPASPRQGRPPSSSSASTTPRPWATTPQPPPDSSPPGLHCPRIFGWMTRRPFIMAGILGSFACGPVVTSLVEPTASNATEGQFTQCFAIRDMDANCTGVVIDE